MESSKAAVFVHSTGLPSFEDAKKLQVRGPAGGTRADGSVQGCCETVTSTMEGMSHIGFQATNLGMATELIRSKMLQGRQFRQTVIQTEDVQFKKRLQYEADDTPFPERQFNREKLPPLIFLGVVSTMLRTHQGTKTIVHDSLVFLAREALVDVMVISGGGPEYDLRNLFGAISRPTSSSSTEAAFRGFITDIIDDVYSRQDALYKAAIAARKEGAEEQYDIAGGRVCEWALGPSAFWEMVGSSLEKHVGRELRRRHPGGEEGGDTTSTAKDICEGSSLLYWCARSGIPIFSPSITDGDMGFWIKEWEARRRAQLSDPSDNVGPKARRWHYPPSPSTPSALPSPSLPSFVFDLTRDIGRLNKLSAWAKNPTCMLIFGGGVIKHHVCNANLFRNGADYSIYVNSAQEYDGSDGGARPDEAVSWGKIKKTAEKTSAVKVYGEVSLIVPLLVAHGFGQFVQRGMKESSYPN